MREQGFADVEAPNWYAVFAPAKTPPELVALLNREVNALLKRDDVTEKLTSLGMVVTGGSTGRAKIRCPSGLIRSA